MTEVEIILSQPEHKDWTKKDAELALVWHYSVKGCVSIGSKDNGSCLFLARRLYEPCQHINRWKNEPDGDLLWVDLMYSDSPEVGLIALREVVRRWSDCRATAFNRRERGLRVFPPKLALKYAKQLFRSINGLK